MNNDKKVCNFYFQIKNNDFRIYTVLLASYEKKGTFKTINTQELFSLPIRYEMMKGYDANDEGLLQYFNDFYKWNGQLFLEIKNSGIDAFTYSYNNKMAVIKTFKKHCNKKIYNLEKNTCIVDAVESFYFENCFNGGLTCCLNGTYECYGYDYNSFYPRILGDMKFADFLIPLNAGKKVKLEHLIKEEVQYGFYNVKITCTNESFLKIFKFCKKNIYTHYSLLFAFKHQEEFNIKIELLHEYDHYLYDQNDLISSREIFGVWFDKLIAIKTKYPQNKLIKHLMSSLWGFLAEFNTLSVTEDEIHKFDCGLISDDCEYYIKDECKTEGNCYYTLMKKDNMYKYDLRLKPFLLSYARNVLGDIAYNNNLDEIIRIYVDNIVYKSNVKFDVENMVLEKKTTGHITWHNNRQMEV